MPETVHPELADGLRTWTLQLAREARQEPTMLTELKSDGSQIVLLEVPDSTAFVDAIVPKPSNAQAVGGHLYYPVKSSEAEQGPLAVAAVDATTVTLGHTSGVQSVLAIAEGMDEAIYAQRPDLHQMLEAFAEMQTATFMFQSDVNRDMGASAGCLGLLFSGGNPLFSLVDLRGMAFGGEQSDQRCSVSLAFQYGSRVPAGIVGSVFWAFSILNSTPFEIPEKMGPPRSINVDQTGGLVMLAVEFDVEKCDEGESKALGRQ